MAKEDVIEVEGEIVDVLPNQTFRVKIDSTETEVTCYTGGKLRQHRIRLVAGDRVRVEMTPYDLTKGRISFRL